MRELTLQEFQRWMQARIRPAGVPTATDDPDALNPQRGTPGTERLAVYAGGYLTRIEQALAEMYPAIRHLLGAGTFHRLAHDYATQHPSHDYNLSAAGRRLPEFLTRWPRTAALPFLPDLAVLERAVAHAFHAFDAPPCDRGRLAALPLDAWDRTRLVFQPSVGLIPSAWPILDLWEARTRPRTAVNVDLVDRPQRVLVFRQGVEVRCAPMETRSYALLDGLLAGRTLGAVCSELSQHAGGAPLPVTDWFATWMAHGLIRDIQLS